MRLLDEYDGPPADALPTTRRKLLSVVLSAGAIGAAILASDGPGPELPGTSSDEDTGYGESGYGAGEYGS